MAKGPTFRPDSRRWPVVLACLRDAHAEFSRLPSDSAAERRRARRALAGGARCAVRCCAEVFGCAWFLSRDVDTSSGTRLPPPQRTTQGSP
ncbi:Protein of unknown function [Gryllus bimaculatus]|nr:Protein of unknown function [Gryllus bimaculatus]